MSSGPQHQIALLDVNVLIALAVHHGGRLASLDQRLSTRAVRGGDACLLPIPV